MPEFLPWVTAVTSVITMLGGSGVFTALFRQARMTAVELEQVRGMVSKIEDRTAGSRDDRQNIWEAMRALQKVVAGRHRAIESELRKLGERITRLESHREHD